MKKTLIILLMCFAPVLTFASSILYDSFEYANHDLTVPVGWTCDDQSWLCGHFDKDHNRTAHSGEWYAFTNASDSWMFIPVYMSTQLKYRLSCWAISDGSYNLEFWAGTEASPDSMSQLLINTMISSGVYENVSAYIEEIASEYQYIGIHAIAAEGAYHLTIDDINVDLVNKYEFITDPSITYTSLYPGEQVSFRFNVTNLGYEPIDVIFFPSYELFTDIHLTLEGNTCTTFHLEPDETKLVTTEATLRPTAVPGTECFLDILLDLDCSCATAMATLWVTVINPDDIEEQAFEQGAQQVEVFDLTGKKVDPAHLKAGIYIERTLSEKGVSTRKIVKK